MLAFLSFFLESGNPRYIVSLRLLLLFVIPPLLSAAIQAFRSSPKARRKTEDLMMVARTCLRLKLRLLSTCS
jgi:hypothetical protein